MEYEHTERRKEARYPIEANVIVHKNSGANISATATDISGAGMLLHVEQPSEFSLDETVTVEAELPDIPGKPFSAWGAGRIVRIDGCRFGIQLYAGTFDAGDERLPRV
ncbi:MAG: PilZ domain-containing protein [Bryobacteraceae bacterium]|jgi:c-di-GMP-binding flagellar brake protein YcgR